MSSPPRQHGDNSSTSASASSGNDGISAVAAPARLRAVSRTSDSDGQSSGGGIAVAHMRKATGSSTGSGLRAAPSLDDSGGDGWVSPRRRKQQRRDAKKKQRAARAAAAAAAGAGAGAGAGGAGEPCGAKGAPSSSQRATGGADGSGGGKARDPSGVTAKLAQLTVIDAAAAGQQAAATTCDGAAPGSDAAADSRTPSPRQRSNSIEALQMPSLPPPPRVRSNSSGKVEENATVLPLKPHQGHWKFTAWDGPPVKVKYTVPRDATTAARVVVVIHGWLRAGGYHKAWSRLAEGRNIVVLSPMFREKHFPSASAFQCGNTYNKAKHENPRSLWTYTCVDGAFALARNKLRLQASQYYMYGHSAGAQFVHRFMYWCPNSPVAAAAAANAGWYTLPDAKVKWPYGVRGTPAHTKGRLQRYLSARLMVLLGDADNDVNDKHLRRNERVKSQGPHRLARGLNFVEACKALAEGLGVECGVHGVVVPGVAHDGKRMAEIAMHALNLA